MRRKSDGRILPSSGDLKSIALWGAARDTTVVACSLGGAEADGLEQQRCGSQSSYRLRR